MEKTDIRPLMNSEGVSIEVPVTKWLVRDHGELGDWVGMLPSGELLVVNYPGPDYCSFSRYLNFAAVAAGRTTDGGCTTDYGRSLLDELAHALEEAGQLAHALEEAGAHASEEDGQ
jgi:hypothetical protein